MASEPSQGIRPRESQDRSSQQCRKQGRAPEPGGTVDDEVAALRSLFVRLPEHPQA